VKGFGIQEILVGLIVIGAVAYLGYRLYHSFQKKNCETNCGCSASTGKQKSVKPKINA